MTKKHYKLIAKVISQGINSEDFNELTASDGLELTARRLATELRNDNASFDQERFLTACGIQ